MMTRMEMITHRRIPSSSLLLPSVMKHRMCIHINTKINCALEMWKNMHIHKSMEISKSICRSDCLGRGLLVREAQTHKIADLLQFKIAILYNYAVALHTHTYTSAIRTQKNINKNERITITENKIETTASEMDSGDRVKKICFAARERVLK